MTRVFTDPAEFTAKSLGTPDAGAQSVALLVDALTETVPTHS